MTFRKRAVSIRMSAADISSVKKLAKRLGARDSDVIRCAVKMMMAKLGPLADSTIRGRNLVPVFVESGSDLFRHFDLDPMRLEGIINDGADEATFVDHDDIQLIAMNGVQRSYMKLRLSAMSGALAGMQRVNGHSAHNGHNGRAANGYSGFGSHDDESARQSDELLDDSLRQYLYDKYVYRASLEQRAEQHAEARPVRAKV